MIFPAWMCYEVGRLMKDHPAPPGDIYAAIVDIRARMQAYRDAVEEAVRHQVPTAVAGRAYVSVTVDPLALQDAIYNAYQDGADQPVKFNPLNIRDRDWSNAPTAPAEFVIRIVALPGTILYNGKSIPTGGRETVYFIEPFPLIAHIPVSDKTEWPQSIGSKEVKLQILEMVIETKVDSLLRISPEALAELVKFQMSKAIDMGHGYRVIDR